MTSSYEQAFVWVWLPDEIEPVVAGKLTLEGERLLFNYGQTYLARKNSISLYTPELPLKEGIIPLLPGMAMPSCIRDASPDAWGRRVILNRHSDRKIAVNELTYLLESGSDRIGALDFQHSATEYVPRLASEASLEELLEATELVEKGLPLTPALNQVINHGTSIGGARPKTLIQHGTQKFIAKFSTSSDLYNVVKAEFIAMRLAQLAGLDVARVQLTKAHKKDVLLVERFDRIPHKDSWKRKGLISFLTLLGLDEMMARYASYETSTEMIRHSFTDPKKTLKELFSRLSFNILVGNTDDHARNHAAFWDGDHLTLTPAYDICPQARAGQEASQAMLIYGDNRLSTLKNAIEASHCFLLSEKEACEIIEKQVLTITENWQKISTEASLSQIDQQLMKGRQFLNPYCYQDLEGKAEHLKKLIAAFH